MTFLILLLHFNTILITLYIIIYTLYTSVFYHLQSTSHVTTLYMSSNTVTSWEWLRTVAETRCSTFVNQILVQLDGNKHVCMWQLHGRCAILKFFSWFDPRAPKPCSPLLMVTDISWDFSPHNHVCNFEVGRNVLTHNRWECPWGTSRSHVMFVPHFRHSDL